MPVDFNFGKTKSITPKPVVAITQEKQVVPQVSVAKVEEPKCEISANNQSKSKEGEVSEFNLNMFVPEVQVGKYIERQVDKDVAFWSGLRDERGHCLSVALIGEASSGKNTMIEKLGADLKLPTLVIPCDDSQILNQMLGCMHAVNGTTVWQEGLLVRFVQKPSIILIDEVNCLPPSRLFMLHELLQNRKLFSKDAPPEKAILNVHKDCHIFLAMNPPTSGYSGTNRLNIALSSRVVFIEVPEFENTEMLLDAGDKKINAQLHQFYSETKNHIKKHNLRVSIGIRNMKRIAWAIKNGCPVGTAVAGGFINSALATASASERDNLLDIATTIFGASTMNGVDAAKESW